MSLLDDKVVLVSGGTQGVGAGIARAAVREGAAVVVTGRRTEIGRAFVDALTEGGAEARFVPCDVADLAQVHVAFEQAAEAFGGVDCLVNSAGLTSRGSLVDTTAELFDAHMAVNVRGPFFLMQEFVRARLSSRTAGSIVNILSFSMHAGQPYLAPYVAAKAALAGATRNAAHAHRYDRIRVNGLNIGWTATEGEDDVQRTFHDAPPDWRTRAAEALPMGRLGDVDEIGEFVTFLLSDRSGVVTGSIIDWDQNVLGGLD